MKPTKKSYDDYCSRTNEKMKTPGLRKSEYDISTGSFRHHPSMAASEENKLPPSFSNDDGVFNYFIKMKDYIVKTTRTLRAE